MKHPKPKPKSSKKPRKIKFSKARICEVQAWIDGDVVALNAGYYNVSECRRLGEFLLKFADWSESRGGK